MTRGSARCLALLSMSFLPSLGCDALNVHPFAGTVAQLTLSGAQVTPANQHLELWARDQYNDIIRLNPYFNETQTLPVEKVTAFGLMIRPALPLDSPCMIDSKGNLLTSAAAYPTTIMVAGTTQTPDEQAAAVVGRIKQVNPAAGPLLAVLPWDTNPDPIIGPNATPAERFADCNGPGGYTTLSPNTYVPNPLQVTAPLHGAVYGFVSFSTVTPATNYDGIRLDIPVGLKGVQEIFFTMEGDTVDPNHRGPLYLVSRLTPGGNDVVHFDLTPPQGSMAAIAGTAALYVNLDVAPGVNQF
jgi:hypothetical protein